MDKINLRNSKFLGGTAVILGIIGSVLLYLLLSSTLEMSLIIPTIFFIVASVIILVAVSDISRKTKTCSIFSNFRTGFILAVISAILLVVAAGSFFMAILTEPFGGSQGYGVGTLVLLIVFCVLFVLAFFFIKRSFDSASKVLDNKYFKISGLLLFVGTVLFDVFILLILIASNTGFYIAYTALIVMLLGAIFAIVAFFTIPNELEMGEPPSENTDVSQSESTDVSKSENAD